MRIVIAGGGLAAGSAAATLREYGFDGDIVIVGSEPIPPYDRPPLSKRVLMGDNPDLAFKPDDYWRETGVTLRMGVVADALDTERKVVTAGGEEFEYDKLLIATGGEPRRLDVPGAGLAGVHLLRTLSDAHAIRADAAKAARVVVVGMGFIGAEVAASLRSRGLDVIAIEPFAVPLERVLGEAVGRSVEQLHRDHGVRLKLRETVIGFEGGERVERVVTGTGDVIDCDMAVVGVGITPATQWLNGSGLKVENGVVVDAACRASAADVYAAGDVARHDHPLFGPIRVEHWQNAINQGAAAARSMLVDESAYADVHWFWSDQYDASLQYAGHHSGETDIVFRGDPSAPPFLAFYMQDAVLKAVFGFNAGRDVRAGMRIVGKKIDPAALADPAVSLRSL